MHDTNEWGGISCPSEPPRIKGGNEEDQRNIMDEGITKVFTLSKPNRSWPIPMVRYWKLEYIFFPTMFETWMSYSAVGYFIGVYI